MDELITHLKSLNWMTALLGGGLGLFVGGLLCLIFRPRRKAVAAPAGSGSVATESEPAPEPKKYELDESAAFHALEGDDLNFEPSLEVRVKTKRKGEACRARFRVTNTGSKTVEVVGWYAQWGHLMTNGHVLLHTHESLPLELEEGESHEFDVDVDQPIDEATKLGVIDRTKTRWVAGD